VSSREAHGWAGTGGGAGHTNKGPTAMPIGRTTRYVLKLLLLLLLLLWDPYAGDISYQEGDILRPKNENAVDTVCDRRIDRRHSFGGRFSWRPR